MQENDNEVYITKLNIKKVRHLENIEIEIDESQRKHLILTGKNGSGKTSVLEELKVYLVSFFSKEGELTKSFMHGFNIGLIGEEYNSNENYIFHYLNQLNKDAKIIPQIKNYFLFDTLFKQGNFILCYFEAKRNIVYHEPGGIKKLELKTFYQIDEKGNSAFLQYIVNLKADRSFARDDGKDEVVKELDAWFMKFEKLLMELFQDESLHLEFDSKNYTFYIITKGRERIHFNHLADGYSAILNIVTELILRMENKSSKIYNIQGIVLIDEIETHLHIDLQKKILPFLSTLFPKVQFIVSTHSPFVLNSIENAVIYDLENKVRVTDLSAYSVDGIIENYFDIDKYSQSIKEKIQEYERLISKESPNEEEKERMFDLKMMLKKIPENFATELVLKFQQIELSRVGK